MAATIPLDIDILSCFASFETALRAERQRDGINRAEGTRHL
jgi:DNA invertase Pin-like site-specific DNA recombinase